MRCDKLRQAKESISLAEAISRSNFLFSLPPTARRAHNDSPWPAFLRFSVPQSVGWSVVLLIIVGDETTNVFLSAV